MKLKHFNPLLWGTSIALSWTWGLGLFFSVQMAVQFGMAGLLFFAIPNAVGLAAFGLFTRHIARKHAGGGDLERHFLNTVGNLRWVFLLYQIVAISLSFFALFYYVFVPLGISPVLAGLVVLGAGLLLGEQFDISRIKWSHSAMGVVILLAVLLIGWGGASYFRSAGVLPQPEVRGFQSVFSWSFIGFQVPIIIGFLLGPWLDIQQWQRAIRIQREKTDIGAAYIAGGLIFFAILLFHGTLALSLLGEGRRLGIMDSLIVAAPDGLFHVKDLIIRFLFLSGVEVPLLFRVMYVVFLCLCVISTLDSGYVALKWFQSDAVKKSESVVVALLPKNTLNSPIPPFTFAALVALLSVPLHFQLEYFIAFYGSFSIGYSMVFLFRTTFEPRFTAFTQTTLVSLAFTSLGIFGVGYFEEQWYMMAAGALIPLTHAVVCIMTRKAVEEIKKSGVMDRIAEGDIAGVVNKIRPGTMEDRHPAEPRSAATLPVVVEPAADLSPQVARSHGAGASCWVEGKWFVHTLTATYQDTNSVGNVYFAQYAMWVGKTRELFFRNALPGFDLTKTPWYILTRSFEHKFIKETKEFEQIEVKLRIESFNRKFVTLEHQVFDSARTMLGKGKQVLLFVSAADYSIIDIPSECHKAFLPYI